MINKVTSVQTKYEYVNIEDLVPQNNILRSSYYKNHTMLSHLIILMRKTHVFYMGF